MTMKLTDRLAAIVPTRRGGLEASQARKHIRTDFDAITAARKRGASWQQIAQAIAEVGIRAENGAELEWRAVMGLYHAERYLRGARPRRHPRKQGQPVAQAAPVRAVTATPAPPVDPPDEEDDRPHGAFRAIPSRPHGATQQTPPITSPAPPAPADEDDEDDRPRGAFRVVPARSRK